MLLLASLIFLSSFLLLAFSLLLASLLLLPVDLYCLKHPCFWCYIVTSLLLLASLLLFCTCCCWKLCRAGFPTRQAFRLLLVSLLIIPTVAGVPTVVDVPGIAGVPIIAVVPAVVVVPVAGVPTINGVRLPLHPATPHWRTHSMAVRAIPLSVCHRGPPKGYQTGFKRCSDAQYLFN